MRAEADLHMGGTEGALLVGLALFWAGSFVFYKVLVAVLPPFTVVFARVAIAAAALNLVLLLRGERLPADRGLWASLAAMGMLNNVVPFSLIVFGETQVSSGVASILTATMPLFTELIAQVLTGDEKPGAGTLAMPGADAWAALFGLSLFSTALAYILFFRILARAGATAMSLVTLLVPVGAVLLGGAFLGERLGGSAWAGMALIGLGLVVLDGRALRRFAPRPG